MYELFMWLSMKFFAGLKQRNDFRSRLSFVLNPIENSAIRNDARHHVGNYVGSFFLNL